MKKEKLEIKNHLVSFEIWFKDKLKYYLTGKASSNGNHSSGFSSLKLQNFRFILNMFSINGQLL